MAAQDLGNLLSESSPYVLSALLGAGCGFTWMLAGTSFNLKLSNRLIQLPIVVAVSGLAVKLLTTWKIEISPASGCAYVLAFFLGVYASWRRSIDSYSAGYDEELFQSELRKLRAIAARNLLTGGREGTEAAVNTFMKSLVESKTPTAAEQVAEHLHSLIHATRDQSIRHQKAVWEAWQSFLESAILQDEFMQTIRSSLRQALTETFPHLHTLLSSAIPVGNPIWLCLRSSCQNEAGETVYRTLYRHGLHPDDRDTNSEDIPEDDGLPKFLKKSWQQGQGVVFIRKRSRDKWFPTKNDCRNQDKIVMAVPVFAKHKSPPIMTCVLTLNSPMPVAFGQGQAAYMKCASDLLSMLITDSQAHVPQLLSKETIDPNR